MKRYVATPALMAAYALILASTVVLISSCGRDVEADASTTAVAPVNVFVEDISQERRALPIRSSGRLATKAEIKLSFKIGGFGLCHLAFSIKADNCLIYSS